MAIIDIETIIDEVKITITKTQESERKRLQHLKEIHKGEWLSEEIAYEYRAKHYHI